jgi:hypothetical protein
MVIAADNDRAMEGQEVGRNPGLIKGQQAASANGAVLMAPSFSEEEPEAGFSDWNDLASHDEVRKGLVAKELEQALQKAFALLDVHQSSVPGNGEDHGDVFDSEHKERANDQNISSGVTIQNEQNRFFSLGKNGVNEYVRTTEGRFVLSKGDEKPRILNEYHQWATPEKDIAGNAATPEDVRVDSGEAEQEPGWVLSSGEAQKEQKTFAPIDKDPRSQWDFRIDKNGVIEHFRTEESRVAVRETGDKIEILGQDHDSVALALERAVERFGGYLHFDGNQAGARTLLTLWSRMIWR